MANPEQIKHRLIEKINDLTPSATPRELTFLSKSLERLNNAVKTDSFSGREGEITKFHQSEIGNLSVNRTHVNAGKHSSPPEFGIYSAHYSYSATVVVYDERLQAQDSHKWMWCHHHTGGHSGMWSYWSSGQRQSCDSWNGNPCYLGSHTHTCTSHCMTNGMDTCGPLGNSMLHVGTEACMAVRFWRDGNQSSGRNPSCEYRNEQLIHGETEPSDKETYIVYDKQTIYLKNRRVLPGAGANANYSQKSSSNGTVNAYGTLTHNADRGEMIVMNHHNTQVDGYGVADWMNQVKIWYNCPTIKADTNLGTYLDDSTSKQCFVRFDDAWDSDRTPTWTNTIGADSTAWPSGATRTLETSKYPIWHPTSHSGHTDSRPVCVTDNKLVLTNNGDLYYSVWYRYGHTLFKSTRYRDPLTKQVDDTYYKDIFVPKWNRECSILNVRGYDEHKRDGQLGYEPIGTRPEKMDFHYLNESYGRDQGGGDYGAAGTSIGGGHFAIQSRNKKNVVCTAPYYRYGCGGSAWIVDKRFNKWGTGLYFRDQTYGTQWGPLGKEGFVLNYSRNSHGANPAHRVWIFRQNLNSGEWTRSEMGRNMQQLGCATTSYPALVPIIY